MSCGRPALFPITGIGQNRVVSTGRGTTGTGQEPAERPGTRGSPAGQQPPTTGQPERANRRAGNMLPGRERRRLGLERILVRLIATCGIVGIGVLLGAILASSKVQGWITGLVVAVVSVVLSAVLWSSRQL